MPSINHRLRDEVELSASENEEFETKLAIGERARAEHHVGHSNRRVAPFARFLGLSLLLAGTHHRRSEAVEARGQEFRL